MKRNKEWPEIVTLSLAGACAAIVLLLTFQMRELREQNVRLRDQVTLPMPGTSLPPLALDAIGGGRLTVADPGPGRAQVLFFFTTTCPFCEASVGHWRRLANDLSANPSADVIGLSRDSTHLIRSYLDVHDLAVDVGLLRAPRAVALMRARLVPITLVVDSLGAVRHAKVGALATDAALDSILDAIDQLVRDGHRSTVF